jgi:3-hydroxy-9,10-secoandrosta-1,3,5(10)-triene-9,17-dione monooxygenase
MHAAFRDAGYYRTLQPRRFGGYEFDLPTFYKLGMAIARGCPSTAWCLILASAHVL